MSRVLVKQRPMAEREREKKCRKLFFWVLGFDSEVGFYERRLEGKKMIVSIYFILCFALGIGLVFFGIILFHFLLFWEKQRKYREKVRFLLYKANSGQQVSHSCCFVMRFLCTTTSGRSL